MSRVRLGLLGASRIAAKILPLVRDISSLEIMGVAARSPESATAFAKSQGLPRSYSSYQDCLNQGDVDAVYISVLNADHAALIEQSLNSGKHVLCEKPLVLNAGDAERLYGLAQKRELILLEALMYRRHPQIRRLRELIQGGKIGEIKSIHVDFSFLLHDLTSRPARATSRGGGGALNDLGCYAVDFITTVVGVKNAAAVERITVSRRRDSEIDVATSAFLRFENGVDAMFSCAIDHPAVNLWEVRGTAGSVAALRFDPQGTEPTPLYIVDEESEVRVINCEQGSPFRDEFENFVCAVLKMDQPYISPEESIITARLMDGIRTAGRH